MIKVTDQHVSIKPLEHLGLVSATITKLDLINKIDRRIAVSKAKGAKVTLGQRVAAMILNGLGFIDDRLYMFPEFLGNKPIDRLIGKGLEASDFNDDALGRCLDEIYKYGVTKLFSEVAFEVGTENNLLGKSAHFDTSSITVHGDYDEAAEAENSAITGIKKQPINITHGYSKDHRPDLKQMIINLATSGAAGFPIWMEAHSGNASDKTIIQEATKKMKDFCAQLKAAPSFMYVGDSAMYENCVKKAGDLKWLSRVSETIKEAKELLRRDAKEFNWTDRENGYSSTTLTSNYGKVKQRWLLVFSEQAFARESKTLERKIIREKEELDKKLWHLSNQPFACEKDAKKASREYLKGIKYHQIDWKVGTAVKHDKKGRPAKNAQAVKTEYFITGVASENKQEIELQKRTKGRFILATNELDETKFSDAEILPEYKEQSKTENGFRFIKGNAMEVSSVFLKKPSRIEALMMIMTLCLMVYSVAQHQLREALKKANETIPNQLKKPTQNPTMTWVCRLFHGVGIVLLNLGTGVQMIVANLNDLTKRIISYFGIHAEIIYGITKTAG